MGISENIKKLREMYGLTQQDLADIAGVTDKAVSTWENGTKEPRMGAIERIAKHFNILKSNIIEDNGLDYIINGPAPLLVKESSVFYKANPVVGQSKKVFLYGSIAAGQPLEMIPVEDRVEVPAFIAEKYPSAFLLRVTGDSMNKVVPSGAYALIDPDAEVKNGDVAAVVVNGYDATLKRFYRLQNTIALEPDSFNPEHVAKIYSTDDSVTLKVIGKMVWYMSAFEVKY